MTGRTPYSSLTARFAFYDEAKPRVLVMVSKFGHCLNDLIFRWRAGTLGGDIALVVSNHEDLRPMAEAAGLPFVHIPVTAVTKPLAEARLLGWPYPIRDALKRLEIDHLVVTYPQRGTFATVVDVTELGAIADIR